MKAADKTVFYLKVFPSAMILCSNLGEVIQFIAFTDGKGISDFDLSSLLIENTHSFYLIIVDKILFSLHLYISSHKQIEHQQNIKPHSAQVDMSITQPFKFTFSKRQNRPGIHGTIP